MSLTIESRRRLAMAKIKMSKEINRDRRRFCGTAAMTIAAAQLNMIVSADAQSSKSEWAQLPAVKQRPIGRQLFTRHLHIVAKRCKR